MSATEKPNLEQLAAKVAAMRMHQREFFRSRDRASLDASKQLEREVDAMTKAIMEPQERLI